MPEPPHPFGDAYTDPEAAMREMMGFNSFSTRRPKNPPDTSLTQVSSHATTLRDPVPDVESSSGLWHSNHPQAPTSTKLPVDEPQRSIPSQPSSCSIPFSTQQQTTTIFTSPETGMSYTSEELDEWTRGKINERGDKVYFKPGFVCDDPWFRLRNTGMEGDNPGQNRKLAAAARTTQHKAE
ncbi:uncharacterized protein Z519_05166 [Cladophialophora bantiana CBS 173.52]|uniref:Uncharacterized protein n=1 Tax=Cladophialophora bantiana (strain ATCC 10958 / CBS 173.52 / CDC B-1940 / NIH 8579) TaxID=1442370 RepID=A0A0D2EVJ1_CLAB1|nr:uncharacterized protein Z519_05166 [Cladophialophora bantiana CBS 173.52]KIW93851.1 hypothetical protein Z519_05166 [Cladophialophora bantiana CBS 173.52]